MRLLRMTSKQKRQEIKRLLSFLSDRHRWIFKQMYALDVNQDIDAVVNTMPANQLSVALCQCQNTYHNLFKVIKTSS